MVYVSSSSITSASRQTVMQVQSELTTSQAELSSGVVQDPGVTLGARSSQLIDLKQQQAQLATFTADNTLASTRLSSTNTVLDTIRTDAQSFLSALTAASSAGGFTPTLQTAAQTSLSSLTNGLNTSVSGQYIFAGINTAVEPLTNYVQSPPSANKTAVDSAFSSTFGFSQTSPSASSISATSMQSFLDGSFGNLFSSSGYSASWSSASNQAISSQISTDESVDTSVSANSTPFRQLAQAYTMVNEFSTTGFSSGAQQAVVSSALSLVSSALTGLTTTQATVGVTQNTISSANDVMKAQSDVFTTQSDSLVGVDSFDLSTRITNLQTQLQASYEMTSKLQNLSLVNYLT